jgi:glycosyltransferase involved in cell wall biosynthesis
VVLATEGTYPFVGGGVSTWCHQLCTGISDVDFALLAVTGSRAARWQFPRVDRVRSVTQVPLWPGEEPEMYLHPRRAYGDVLRRRWQTRARRVARDFVPAVRTLLREVFFADQTITALVAAVVRMGAHLRANDYKASIRSSAVWDAMLDVLDEYARSDATPGAPPTLADATTCGRWLYSMLMPLAMETPTGTVYHATAAAGSALPGVVARHLDGMPLVVTEHGVYVRERYLAVSAESISHTQKRFLTGLAAAVGRVCYASADVIAPVASFNARWEVPLGAARERIRVIYNGVDTTRFRPGPRTGPPAPGPVVVAAARVFPLKDVENLIQATQLCLREHPELRVRVYGALDADPPYVAQCQKLAETLGLGAAFALCGPHASPPEMYREGDISVLSSISEGFPYTVLESMACSVPCVATDVGGVREAVDDTGIVVPPRAPEALAEGMCRMLREETWRRELGARARARVVERFSLERQLNSYRDLYAELHERGARGQRERVE